MTNESLVNEDWGTVVSRLGGPETLNATARETRAFVRPREISNAVDLLRLILAYCLGERGLRLTAAWATSVGLADVSNVALLYRLRQCGDWLALLVGQALAAAAPKASRGRLIRIVDATTVPKKGREAKTRGLWRIHGAFDLPQERFGHFELTDQQGGETLDRIPVVKGEIRIGDRAYLQPNRMAALNAAGADFVIRAGWKSARWRDAEGRPVDLAAELRAARSDHIDRPIWIKLKRRPPACRAPGGHQEIVRGSCRRAAESAPASTAGRSSALPTNARGCRLGDPGDLPAAGRFCHRRCSCALSSAMAH